MSTAATAAVTVVLADDHPLFRAALKQAVLEVVPGARLVECADAASLRAAANVHESADLVLLDLMMPGSRSFAELAWLRSQYPGMAVLVVSAAESPAVLQQARAYGAAGYVPKSAPLPELVAAIRTVLEGGEWLPAAPAGAEAPAVSLASRLATLTPQQFRVLELLALGKLNKQIAAELGISEQTTKAHVSATLAKLGARNRTQATLIYRELEIREDDPLSLDR
ncbi:MAG: response regulator transcription factor [Steroidobacteraceae bacterium]|nr:response regulator transcription factor [Steroidobacteraceae bacterium]